MTEDERLEANCTMYLKVHGTLEIEHFILATMISLYAKDSPEVAAQAARVATLERMTEVLKKNFMKGKPQ